MKGIAGFLLFLIVSILARASEEQLQVGMELTYPPFEMINKEGKPSGVSVDLAKALGVYLGKETVIQNLPFVGLIPALKSGKIDLILSSMTVTKERSRSIDFSDPYLQTGLCLLIYKLSEIQSIADVDQKGKIVVVKQGTTGQVYAEKHLKKAKVLVLDKESSCTLEVAQGKADAFIYDQFSIYANWKKNPETTKAILTPFAIEYWAIGMRKGDNALREQVNAFLREFRKNGGMEKLGDRYLKEQKMGFKQLGIPFNF